MFCPMINGDCRSDCVMLVRDKTDQKVSCGIIHANLANSRTLELVNAEMPVGPVVKRNMDVVKSASLESLSWMGHDEKYVCYRVGIWTIGQLIRTSDSVIDSYPILFDEERTLLKEIRDRSKSDLERAEQKWKEQVA